MIEIRVLGVAAPQGSKISTRWGMRESSSRVKPWRHSVSYACADQYKGPVIDQPVTMEIEFVLPRAKGHYGTGRNAGKLKASAPAHCTSALWGDLDKLARSTLDGCAVRTGGTLIADDRLVVQLSLCKRYAELNEPAGALVRLQTAC